MTINPPIFVIGFPKSGTNWLTRLVCEALQAPASPGMLDDAPHVEKLNAALGFGPGSGPVVCRTHLRPADLAEFMGAEATRGIYIYRDLRDVLISGFMYQRTADHEILLAKDGKLALRDVLSAPWSAMRRVYWRRVSRRAFSRFVTRMCSRGWGPFGGWSEHIAKWREYTATGSERRIVFISYEALTEDCAGVLEGALAALDLQLKAPGGIDAVVDSYTVKRLRNAESARAPVVGEGDPHHVRSVPTLRKGIVGDHSNFMTRSEARIVEQLHGAMLRELGYVEDSAWIRAL